MIAGRTLLDRVIDSCVQAARFISKSQNVRTIVAVLTPTGDPIVKDYGGRCEIFEGDEFDVLRRYADAATHYGASHVVRITGDCPLIHSYVIEGLVKIALREKYDYIGNCDERCRTSIDGLDCEVISSSILWQTNDLAKSKYDREHVTPFIRNNPLPGANIGVVINHLDLSHIKLSVDTEDDLAAVEKSFNSGLQKYQHAVRTYGHGKVHRL